MRLFSANDELTTKHRRLIVDLEPPAFDISHHHSSSHTPNPLPNTIIPSTGSNPSPSRSPSRYKWDSHSDFSDLNVDQRKAINNVLSAKDYALVLGMPGTGKVFIVMILCIYF